MYKDLVKNMQQVYSWLNTVEYDNGKTLVDDVKEGKLPSWDHWWWNKFEHEPCYVVGDEVYCMSESPVGEFFLLGTVEDLKKEADERIELTEWGKERLKYLNAHDYGTAFGMLCSGTLWEHCKEVEEEAKEQQDRMIRERMRQFEALKNKDPLEYSCIWNNEMQTVQDIIRRELICK